MCDYIPTTDDVEEVYVFFQSASRDDLEVASWGGPTMTKEKAQERFHRWLASVKYEVWREGALRVYEASFDEVYQTFDYWLSESPYRKEYNNE